MHFICNDAAVFINILAEFNSNNEEIVLAKPKAMAHFQASSSENEVRRDDS